MKLSPWFAAKMTVLSPFFSGLGTSAPMIPASILLVLGLAVGFVAFLFSPKAEKAYR